MNVIVLNNSEFPVTSYSKVTSFNGDNISSNAYLSLETDNIDTLNALGEVPITSIKIYHDDTLIYDLSNINAHIDTINENLGEDRIYINVNMTFISE